MEYQNWITKNPLLRWRQNHEIGISAFGRSIGAKHSSIFQWESGVSFPSARFWNPIKAVTHAGMLREMVDWWADCPDRTMQAQKEDETAAFTAVSS